MDQRRPTLYSSEDTDLHDIEEQEEPEIVMTTEAAPQNAGKTVASATAGVSKAKKETKIPVKTKAGKSLAFVFVTFFGLKVSSDLGANFFFTR